MGYAGEAMNELHRTDAFTEEQRVVQPEPDWRREMEKRGEAVASAMGRYRGREPLVEAVARLSSDYHDLAVRDAVLNEVGEELAKARATHAPMNGHHEGYAVILEEVDELWEVCKANTHSFSTERPKWAVGDLDPQDKEALRRLKRAALRKEALQVAATAVRFIEDVCDRENRHG